MAINPALLSGVRITAPAPKKEAKKEVNPIANRDFGSIPFIRDAAPECNNAMEALIAAWEDSPQETILSMLSCGIDKPDIARAVGFDLRSDEDKKEWNKILVSTRTYAQLCISEDLLREKNAEGEWVSVIPDDYSVEYIDSKDEVRTAECADRVRRALHKALWRSDFAVVCSIARGVPLAGRLDKQGKPIYYKMWEVITWTRDKIEIIYHQADEQLARMMRSHHKLQYLTPGMLKHIQTKAAAAAAAASADANEDND